jgi:murein DD-endopeptidase MepM/ murein hydrolase activator NlpD
MRFSSAAILVLLTTPGSANAAEHWAGLDRQPPADSCLSKSDLADRSGKPRLLADKTAGELIQRSGVLAPASAPAAAGIGKDRATTAGTEARCQTSSLSPDIGTSFSAMAARLSRLAAVSPRMPLIAGRLSSGFGWRVHPLLAELRMHSGVDLAAPLGSPIFATDSGRISIAGWQGGYGLAATIEHANGLQTRYGHMSRLNVVAGQHVERGQIIGFVGSTGLSTGPHLHYEVRFRGQAINPLSIMTPLNGPPMPRKAR